MSGSEYYDHTTYPSSNSAGSSSLMRAELDAIEAGFDKLPNLAGNASRIVMINSGATGMTVAVAGTDYLAPAAIGVTVQAYDADLSAIAALSNTDGNFIVGNGSTWVAESGATVRASLGLTIGTHVQAYDAGLAAIAALSVTDGNFIVGNGSTWVAESGATVRTSLGLGTMATETATNYAKTSAIADIAMNDYKISGIKTASFERQGTLTTTTGAVTINWASAQNYKQNEPTGDITYTFSAPPGPCHLQLLIHSDGTSMARTFTWPASVIWYGGTWNAIDYKKAIINFWYDGTNYHAQGVNQV